MGCLPELITITTTLVLFLFIIATSTFFLNFKIFLYTCVINFSNITIDVYRCNSTICLPLTNLCDGEVDCLEGVDEANCCKNDCNYVTGIHAQIKEVSEQSELTPRTCNRDFLLNVFALSLTMQLPHQKPCSAKLISFLVPYLALVYLLPFCVMVLESAPMERMKLDAVRT